MPYTERGGFSKTHTYYFHLWKTIIASGKPVFDSWSDNEVGLSNFFSDIGERPSKRHFFRLFKRKIGYFPNNCGWVELKSKEAGGGIIFNIPADCSFPGVYKILFDDSWFYIGSAKNLFKRASVWQHRICIKEPQNKNILEIIDKTRIISFYILEKVDDISILRKKETEWIVSEWENKFLLNRCPYGHTNKDIRPYNGYVKPQKIKGQISPPKPVAQFGPDGNLIRKFYSVGAAERETGCRQISLQLQGKRGGYKGFIFKEILADGSFKEPPQFVKTKRVLIKKRVFVPSKRRKPIIQYDLQNNFIANFDSCWNAGFLTGIHQANIRRVLKGRSNSAGGFIFRYA
jgi:hypothetical protein